MEKGTDNKVQTLLGQSVTSALLLSSATGSANVNNKKALEGV